MKPEPRLQQRFSIGAAMAALAIIGAVLLAHHYFRSLPNRQELGPRTAELRFKPAALDPRGFAPLRLAGAWEISSDDPRVGGISALAIDGGELMALTDSGVVIRFAKPGSGSGAVFADIRELPGGPGDPGSKTNRDSEALVRDPAGRGWWVAFESRDALWLYDPGFARALQRRPIPPRGLSYNTGIEGMASSSRHLLLFPETGGLALHLGSTGWKQIPFGFPARSLSDAVALPDDSLLVIERELTVTGFANALARLKRCSAGFCLSWRKTLAVAPLDNAEAVAAEPLQSGGTRLWIATDDNLNPRLRTLLIAVDLPPQR